MIDHNGKETNYSNSNKRNLDGKVKIRYVDTKSKSPKRILHPMKIDLCKNSVTAILGPSGSGKTTFLNYVSGTISRDVKTSGEGKINGIYVCFPACNSSKMSFKI